MLARLQRSIVLFILLAAATWAAIWVRAGRPWFALIGAVAILCAHMFFLAAEFVVLFFVQSADVVPAPLLRELIRAWLAESIAAPAVFYWRQPFRSNAEPDQVEPSASRGHVGIVLVHGLVCNRGLWAPWMRALRAEGVPFVAIDLEPLFGSIDDYAQSIESAVARMERATGRPVVLVGHSMGGLAIRAWMSSGRFDARVLRVVTIGSPHRGTWMARWSHTINGRQMRLGSPWLENLSTPGEAAGFVKFTCFFSHCDNIVFPAEAATLPGADNIHVPGEPHVRMAFRRPVFDEVMRWVRPAA